MVKINQKELNNLILVLKQRFESNLIRHVGIDWETIEKHLTKNSKTLMSIYQMEKSGGEPDVVKLSNHKDEIFYVDCSKESPDGRRSLCYDKEAHESRKENKPKGSAVQLASNMGVTLLTEQDYFDLQSYGAVDTKTSSWLNTPENIRKLGGAIFGDYKFGRTFIYHNGAQSYYAARGFRAKLKID